MVWWIIVELLLWQMASYVWRSAKASRMAEATAGHDGISVTSARKEQKMTMPSWLNG